MVNTFLKYSLILKSPLSDPNLLCKCISKCEHCETRFTYLIKDSSWKVYEVRSERGDFNWCRFWSSQVCTLNILLYVLFYYKSCLDIFPQFSVISTVQSPKKYFYYMKNENYGEKIGLTFISTIQLKNNWRRTPISTVLVIEY